MTINAPAALLLLLYELVAEEQGVAGDTAPRHRPERHPQGVRGARELHLPAAALDADHDRPLRVLPRAAAAAGTRSRSPATTSARRARPRCRSSRSRSRNGIAYCAGGRATRASRRTSSASGSPSSSTRTTTSSRRWRSSARRGGSGRGSCATGSARRTRRRWRCASTRRRAARRSPRSSRRTTSCASPIQALSAVCGGAQSIHTNGFDEALALPTERSARIALRTQQILAARGGRRRTRPTRSAARYFIEALTDELEARALELIERIDELGGAVEAIEQGFVQREIEEAAYALQRQVEAGERVDRRRQPLRERRGGADRAAPPRPRGRAAPARADATRARRAQRRRGGERRSPRCGEAADGDGNLLPPMREAPARALHRRRDLQRAARRVRARTTRSLAP